MRKEAEGKMLQFEEIIKMHFLIQMYEFTHKSTNSSFSDIFFYFYLFNIFTLKKQASKQAERRHVDPEDMSAL